MPGRFKLDENIPRSVEPVLREVGHDAETARSEGLAGAPDPDLLAACSAEDRVLVTLDLDFADIRAYPPGVVPDTESTMWVRGAERGSSANRQRNVFVQDLTVRSNSSVSSA